MERNTDNETDRDSLVKSYINTLPSLRTSNKHWVSIRHGRVSDTIMPPSLIKQPGTDAPYQTSSSQLRDFPKGWRKIQTDIQGV